MTPRFAPTAPPPRANRDRHRAGTNGQPDRRESAVGEGAVGEGAVAARALGPRVHEAPVERFVAARPPNRRTVRRGASSMAGQMSLLDPTSGSFDWRDEGAGWTDAIDRIELQARRRETVDPVQRAAARRAHPASGPRGRSGGPKPRDQSGGDGRTAGARMPGGPHPYRSANRPMAPVASGVSTAATAVAFAPAAAPVREPIPEPERRPPLRVVPQASPAERRRQRRFGALAVLATAAVGVGFFGAVVLHASLAQGQIRLEEIRREVGAAAHQQTLLHAEIAQLKSPARIVSAASRLGLITPDGVTFVNHDDAAVTADPPVATTVALAGAGTASSEQNASVS